ncbi:1-acyl-sn-glycerol-3-phosphate acyltransferase [Sphingomonas sp. MMSM20]|uniref:lysophospholipid acyltransferase family protein n=1 Tax=Sphingomonas lycopersici TaxID=2951807 RepID=UPI002237E0AD|nr:lysophospholipid acyltransferase family protein [Sphingomonas lycopersici]MCW6529424.1 1-acyl-sn-glycerol-3-phosphate acyltransferase [Sphingomonas lycopersici]
MPIGPDIRLYLRLAAIILALLVAVPTHLLWRLLRLPSPWPKWFLGAMGWIIGARRRVIGTPLRRDVVFLSNHLSWMDIPILAGANGSAFVAKAEVEHVPIVGWLCTLNRTIFVRREDRLGIAGQINQLREALAETWAITIFPEGTTSDGETLLPFKAALLAVLDPPPPGVLVQPVRIDYGDATRELAWVGDEPGLDHAKRVLRRPGNFTATLHFCDPFDPRDFPGRKAIAAEARARVAAAGGDPAQAPV